MVCLTDRRTLQHLTVSNGSCSRLVRLLDGRHRPVEFLTDHRTQLLRFRLLARRFAFRPGRRLVGAAGKEKKTVLSSSLCVVNRQFFFFC